MIDFDAAIAPLSRSDFIANYWNRAPLHQHGEAGRFAPLLDWLGLTRILETHQFTPLRLRLVQDGEPIEPERYLRGDRHQQLDVRGLTQSLRAGATLVLDGIQGMVPQIGALTLDCGEALGAAVTANLYAGMQGSRGFARHWDPQDVLILQLTGRKRWRVHAPTQVNPLRGASAPLPEGDPDWEGVLEDGDSLYLPRGWWHVAEADEAPSLHLTVTIVPPRGVDFVAWLVREFGDSSIASADIPHAAAKEARSAYFRRLAEAVAQAAGAEGVAERFLESWAADYPPPARLQLPVAEANTALNAGSIVSLPGIRSLVFRGDGSGSYLFDAGGQAWHCTPAVRTALALLTGAREIPWPNLEASLADRAERRALARLIVALAAAGVAEIRNPSV
jgi:ribosomal protein L16 Arg81 hydroxylase